MAEILQTIDCLKPVWIRDYVEYNEDRFGYVIEIIGNNDAWIREAPETGRVTMDKVKKTRYV